MHMLNWKHAYAQPDQKAILNFKISKSILQVLPTKSIFKFSFSGFFEMSIWEVFNFEIHFASATNKKIFLNFRLWCFKMYITSRCSKSFLKFSLHILQIHQKEFSNSVLQIVWNFSWKMSVAALNFCMLTVCIWHLFCTSACHFGAYTANGRGARCCSEFTVAEFTWYLDQSRSRMWFLVVSMHRHGKEVKKHMLIINVETFWFALLARMYEFSDLKSKVLKPYMCILEVRCCLVELQCCNRLIGTCS